MYVKQAGDDDDDDDDEAASSPVAPSPRGRFHCRSAATYSSARVCCGHCLRCALGLRAAGIGAKFAAMECLRSSVKSAAEL